MTYPATVEGFDHAAYFGSCFTDAEWALLESAEPDKAGARRELRVIATERDPLLFALTYLRHHLKGPDGAVTFSDAHLDWCRQAEVWATPVRIPAEDRSVQVAPRETGKSTWWFLILPLWAAAHGHVRFAAAFADSTKQAEDHLATLKHELDSNPGLRRDFPDLCAAAKRPAGTNVSDNRGMLHTRSGFVFAAKGIDSNSLGMKVRERRPDLLILDDVEKGEGTYSAHQAEQRLLTMLDVVLPLNLMARVVLVGTVTMPGSIVHEAVKAGQGRDHADWVDEEGFRVAHHLPVVRDALGAERSIWPAKWPLAWLRAESGKRSYAKNFLNDPAGADGGYWSPSDFRYAEPAVRTRGLLSIDPAVTTTDRSDWTGVACVSGDRARRTACVEDVMQVRMTGDELRSLALRLLARHPWLTHVIVEDNQGGDLWLAVFHDMPVPVRTFKSTARKEVRAAEALNHYQRGRVTHRAPMPDAEAQMCAFGKPQPHDDMVDAVSAAVNRLCAAPAAKRRASGSSRSYVG